MNQILLIAEQDSTFGMALIDGFKKTGQKPHVIRTTTTAIEQIKELKPALIIVDIAVQPKGGYDFIEHKNRDASIAKIPVVLFSNGDAPVDPRRAAGLGACHFVEKNPASVADVLDAAKKCLDHTAKLSPLDGKTVLWVEDDAFLANILTKKFVPTGCNLVRVKNGEEALAYLAKNVPSVILLDILLPGMNGFDILQKIKMDLALRPVPVIILSNTSQSSDLEKGEMLGAQKFLIKATVTLDEIIQQVASLVK